MCESGVAPSADCLGLHYASRSGQVNLAQARSGSSLYDMGRPHKILHKGGSCVALSRHDARRTPALARRDAWGGSPDRTATPVRQPQPPGPASASAPCSHGASGAGRPNSVGRHAWAGAPQPRLAGHDAGAAPDRRHRGGDAQRGGGPPHPATPATEAAPLTRDTSERRGGPARGEARGAHAARRAVDKDRL
eukprot:scaffold93523_cov43-Phaeocystis_antarctica.AAC.2